MRMGGGRYHFTLIGRKFPLQAGYMNIHEWGGMENHSSQV